MPNVANRVDAFVMSFLYVKLFQVKISSNHHPVMHTVYNQLHKPVQEKKN
ncbi:hypothetical protein ACTFQ5_16275 [Aliivibrio fischeri]